MTSPAHRIRIGNLSATIWRNLGTRGNWYSVKLTRGFKTDEGWRNTENFGLDDLHTARKLLDQAEFWITQQLNAEKQAVA